MNNPFTVEETNLMCVFETSNRMKLMEEIRRVMLHIKDRDKWVDSRLQWLATCFLFYNHKIDCEKSLDKL